MNGVPRILVNPNHLTMPDHAGPGFSNIVDMLAATNITREAAIAQLEEAWTASQEALIKAWDEQVARDRKEAEERRVIRARFYACLTTTFYATARLGEFTIPTLDAFEPDGHVKRSDIRCQADKDGLEVTVFHIPRTKSAPLEGEDVYWARQDGPSDPEEALREHLRLNDHGDTQPLFSYTDVRGCRRPMTRPAFLARLSEVGRAIHIDFPPCHGIRIGSTVEYLLRGIAFEVMQVKGRWASDAFILYLRRHAEIMAPYIQAISTLQAEFNRRIRLPPVR